MSGGGAEETDVRKGQKAHGVYAEQPVSGKRTEHDPHVFLTPANPSKRQTQQIPLQRKLPLRYLSLLRQTSGPGGLFSYADLSRCDTELHLFGCEVLIKSERGARRLALPPSPELHLSVEGSAKLDKKRQADGRKRGRTGNETQI